MRRMFSRYCWAAACAASNTPLIRRDASAIDPASWSKISRLANAALYSPEGAVVRIAVSRAEDTVVLTIENEDVYLDPDTIPRLFEAFYRPDPSRNRQTGGSGLGLYLVRTIAERHGGTCSIRNTEQGVEVRLTLPNSTQNTHVP